MKYAEEMRTISKEARAKIVEEAKVEAMAFVEEKVSPGLERRASAGFTCADVWVDNLFQAETVHTILVGYGYRVIRKGHLLEVEWEK